MRMHGPPPAKSAVRRGVTTPLVAVALLLAVLGLALILDRLWLDAAQVELTSAGEAAALAAAHALVGDDRLKPQPDEGLIANRAIDAAVSIAEQNTVGGSPVTLDLAAGDVQVGQLVASDDTGLPQFVQTDSQPTHVRVALHRSRSRGNPVALFLSQLTRQPHGDVVANVEAGLDNALVGLRPFDGGPIPALPLAIWQEDPSGKCKDTWRLAIEQRGGGDQYGYDATAQQVTAGADGIPEITLRSQPRSGASNQVNVQLIDIGSGLEAETLARQFSQGVTVSDLESWDGELSLSSSGLQLPSTPALQSTDRDGLSAQIGAARIVLLYSQALPQSNPLRTTSTVVEFVAIRILTASDGPHGAAEIVVQPAIVTTRTAITDASQSAAGNSYIYRLTLTR